MPTCPCMQAPVVWRSTSSKLANSAAVEHHANSPSASQPAQQAPPIEFKKFYLQHGLTHFAAAPLVFEGEVVGGVYLAGRDGLRSPTQSNTHSTRSPASAHGHSAQQSHTLAQPPVSPAAIFTAPMAMALGRYVSGVLFAREDAPTHVIAGALSVSHV